MIPDTSPSAPPTSGDLIASGDLLAADGLPPGGLRRADDFPPVGDLLLMGWLPPTGGVFPAGNLSPTSDLSSAGNPPSTGSRSTDSLSATGGLSATSGFSSASGLPPSEEELWGLLPDTDYDPPDDENVWLTNLPADVLCDDLDSPTCEEPPEALPAGLLPRSYGNGAGFASGGVADRMAPGPTLAGFAAGAWADRLGQITDDELIGVLLAWRRLNSWTVAGELAAVAELSRRRDAEVAAGADPHLAEHVGDELAVALTLTARSADGLLEFACGLARLPLTRAALARGDIDRAKALIIADGVAGLAGQHAAAVESAVITQAPSQTTGQLRAATRSAVLAADPTAATRRREEATKDARVEVWDERSGTAALAGRDLPPADVLAADKRIDNLARRLKEAGHEATLSQLRAKVYTALLLGRPAETLTPEPLPPAQTTPSQTPAPAAAGAAGQQDSPPAHSDVPVPGGVSRPHAPPMPASPNHPPGTRSHRQTPDSPLVHNNPAAAGPGPASPGACSRPGHSGHPAAATASAGRAANPAAAEPAPTSACGKLRPQISDRPATATASPGRPANPAATEPAPTSASDKLRPQVSDRPATATASPGRPANPAPAPSGPAGWLNLTLPLAAWLGASDWPGEVAGFGPVPADDARVLAGLIAAQPGSRTCLTLTDSHGRPIAHGCVQSGHRAGRYTGSSARSGSTVPANGAGRWGGWPLTVSIRPLAIGDCSHDRESGGYQPSPSLRHVINLRQQRCSFRGCRQPATRCDHDHTIPYDKGGRTCECNLAPLCRRHHQAKQAQGWRLSQPEPGVLIWQPPHGRSYRVEPDSYPDEPGSSAGEAGPGLGGPVPGRDEQGPCQGEPDP